MKFFNTAFVKEGEIYGEEVFSQRVVAPKWYWVTRATVMFFDIVWRQAETYVDEQGKEHPYRLSIKTSF